MRRRDHAVIREKRAALQLSGEGRKALEGLPVILAGWIAEEGTALLAAEKEEELSVHFHPEMVDAARRIRAKALPVTEMPACVWPLSEGGILAGLWKLITELDCGLRADLKAIPVRQESIEICEYFGIDPYRLLSGGAYLIVTALEVPFLAALQAAGVKAAVIGRLTSDEDCLLTCDGRIRFLNRPEKDSPAEAEKNKTGESRHADQHRAARA